MPKDANAGAMSGSNTWKNDPDVAGAVDASRLEQRGRDLLHEVVQ